MRERETRSKIVQIKTYQPAGAKESKPAPVVVGSVCVGTFCSSTAVRGVALGVPIDPVIRKEPGAFNLLSALAQAHIFPCYM